MSNYSSIKATINANIKTNGNKEITGSILNSVLLQIVDAVGAGYRYLGIATPSNPGTNQSPDYNCFYLSVTPGTYTHLGNLVVNSGEVAILKYDTTWKKDVTGVATKSQVNSIIAQINAINDALGVQSQVVTQDVAYTTTNQYIANYDPPQINNNSNYRLSNLIHFKKGDIVYYTGSTGSTNVVLVARYQNNVWTKLLVGDSNQTTQSLQYEVTDDNGADIYFCWYKTPDPVIRVRTTITSSRLDDIEDVVDNQFPVIKQAVEDITESMFSVVNDNLTTGLVTGKYITHTGTLATNSTFGYKEFAVKAGAKIVFYAQYANPGTAALAKKILPPSSTTILYEEIVAGANYTEQTISYTAPEDMTIAVCIGLGNNPSTQQPWNRNITITTNILDSLVTNMNDVVSKQENANVVQATEFGFMFNKIAVIGDSLASGRVEGIVGQPDAVGADYYGFSWLSFLSKRWRCDKYKNYSRAGEDTATWISYWLPIFQADTQIYDLYFIALGTNNEYDESNPSGDQANLNAYISRYNSIIDAVRAKAPHAAIMIVSLYEDRQGNETLEDIAADRMQTDNGIYYIDYAHNAEYFRYSPEVNWRGHFSSTGYAYVASAINQILNNVIWANQTNEFWQQFAKYHNVNPE